MTVDNKASGDGKEFDETAEGRNKKKKNKTKVAQKTKIKRD